MIIGINANNQGRPLGAGTVELIRARGFQMIRVPGTFDDPPFDPVPIPTLQQMVQEILDGGLVPMVIVRDAAPIRELPSGIYINYTNEPDVKKFKWTKSELRQRLPAVIAACEGYSHLAIPGVSNLNKRGFEWAEIIPWNDVPDWVIGDFHSYADGDSPVRTNTKERLFLGGTEARDREIRHFRSIVGPHRIGCGEVGYHLTHGLTEAKQAEHMRYERDLFERHDLVYACAFQINDGPPGNTETDGNYGFRRHPDLGGGWKPVAEAWTGVTT